MGGYIIAHQLAARDTPLPSRGIAHAHASHAPSFVILPVDCDGSQFRYPRGSTLRLSDVQSVTEPLEPLPRSVLHKRQQQPSPVAHTHRYRMPGWPAPMAYATRFNQNHYWLRKLLCGVLSRDLALVSPSNAKPRTYICTMVALSTRCSAHHAAHATLESD